MDKSYGEIYVITNIKNGKQYVGQTTDSYQNRYKEHCQSLNRADRKHSPLYAAFNKYGLESFTCSLLEKVPVSKLDEREQYWIEKLGTFVNGYNATAGGQRNKSYYTEEECQHILEAWLECDKNATLASNRLKCSRAVIRKVAQSYGYITDERPRFDHKELAEKVKQLGSVPKVAELYQCDRSIVYDACHEYGILLSGKSKPINQYDKEGNFIRSYNSITEAVEYLKRSGINARTGDICSCCSKKQKTAFGYKWDYRESKRQYAL